MEVAGQPLDLQRSYYLATKEFLYKGKDGFGMMADCQLVQSSEACPVLPYVLERHLRYLQLLNDAVAQCAEACMA